MENPLTLTARQRMREGSLPSEPPFETDGGRTRGNRCKLCGVRMQHGAPMICIKWIDSSGREREAPLHPTCHAVWLSLLTGPRSGTV